MVSLAESSIVNISVDHSAKLALAFRAGPRRSVPGANATLRAAMPLRTAFGFLARPAAVNTLRLKQPRH